MSRYLRTYLFIILGLILACILALWAIDFFEGAPQLRMLVILGTAVVIAGTTRLFWFGRRDDD